VPPSIGLQAFIIDAIRTANPVWHQSSSVCHSYESSQVGQTQRNPLSLLPESTPRIAYYQTWFSYRLDLNPAPQFLLMEITTL